MDNYSYNDYYYPQQIQPYTKNNYTNIQEAQEEKYISTYIAKKNAGRPIDSFYFQPTKNLPEKNFINSRKNNKYIEPNHFNESGILRETYNYTLYENKNWKQYPEYEEKMVQAEIIEEPPEIEIINEEIELNAKKKYMKSKFVRKIDKINKIKKKKFKYKQINTDNNFIRDSDNGIHNIYYFKNGYNKGSSGNYDEFNNGKPHEESEIKQVRQVTSKKKISDKFHDKFTTKKEYKVFKSSKIQVPKK